MSLDVSGALMCGGDKAKEKTKQWLCTFALKPCFITDDFTITGSGIPSKRKQSYKHNPHKTLCMQSKCKHAVR